MRMFITNFIVLSNYYVSSYQKNGNQNILILDWGELADGNYLLDAVQNAKQVRLYCFKARIFLYNFINLVGTKDSFSFIGTI